MAFVQVKDLDKWFSGVHAINNLSFHVEQGEILGIIGPNGAGKTTLFNLITGVTKPTAGEVIFDCRNLTALRPSQMAKFGILRTFQNLKLFNNMCVRDNVKLGMHARTHAGLAASVLKFSRTREEEFEIHTKADHWLSLTGLLDKADVMAGDLPYGERKRLEIARALAGEPRLLLLDEPAAGVTNSDIDDLIILIKQLKASGMTIMLIEHRLRFLMGVVDRIVVIDRGEKIAEGLPEVIRNDPKVIKAYLGKDGADHA